MWKYLIITVVVMLYGNAWGEPLEESCDRFHADYIPSARYDPSGQAHFYSLRIERNPEYDPPNENTRLIFTLKTFDNESGDLANTVRMPYICSLGSIVSCKLSLAPNLDRYNKLLSVTFFDDFSAKGHTETVVPHAVVLSDPGVSFYYLDWDDVENIAYVSGDKNTIYNKLHRPNFSVPEVWIIDDCLNNE